MPLAASFGAASVRGLGLGNGEVPRAPVITTPASDDTTIATPISLAISYTITISTFPLSHVQYKLDKIDASNNVTDAGNWTGTLPGASGSNSATITTRVNSSGAVENLLHSQKYRIYLRSVDAAGQTGPESTLRRFTTANEVGPTAAAPSPFSPSVSYPNQPYIQFTWSAGTNGTYAIATRQYSVVAGSAPGAGTYTTLSGASGTSSAITTTASGQAIVPGNTYTVYIKCIAASPGAGESVAYTVFSAGAENPPLAPNAASISRHTTDPTTQRTNIVISPGSLVAGTTPTYDWTYQYALSTSNPPTSYVDWPGGKSTSAQVISGREAGTTYYVRFRTRALTGTSVSAATTVQSVTTRANVPNAPGLSFSGMSSSSWGNPTFSITNGGGSTSTIRVYESGYAEIYSTSSSTTATVTRNYTSDGSTKYYYAVASNVDGDTASSSTIQWTLPAKNQFWTSGYVQTTAIFFSNTASCASEFSYTFGSIPDNDNQPGYIAVSGARIDGVQATGANQNGCSASQTLANTAYLFWRTTSGHPEFGFGLNNNGLETFWGTGNFTTRYGAFSGYGGSSLTGTTWSMHSNAGSRTGACAVGCSTTTVSGVTTLNAYRLKNFLLTGIQTTYGSGTGF